MGEAVLSEGGRGGGVVGGGGARTQRVRRGRSVPHPGLDAASSGKVFSPDPGSPSLARPPADPAQRTGWPGSEQ